MATLEEAQEVIRDVAKEWPRVRQTSMASVNNWDSEIFEEFDEYRIAAERWISKSIDL